MGAVTASVVVRRPLVEVAKVATDPDVVLPLIGGFGRFQLIEKRADGSEEWDLFIDVGTIHVGGRVEVEAPGGSTLSWRSARGTRHWACIEVHEAGRDSEITMRVSTEFAGLLTGPLTGFLARGIIRRHVEAGLEQLRHHLEHENPEK
jgi:Polyketide cyclase / dehydrase and lipid transport